ncbi:MAG: DUF3501 family protein [Sphingomonadales bacterium]|nr:MAG: DUF3501 family protein [Sphingomonadales bacterium]
MPKSDRRIDPADLMAPGDYAAQRADLRRQNVERKRLRRLSVGPHATLFFESYETMLQQVQEMLHIERGGDAQTADELDAYNPMIPSGSELTATLMFEINDPDVRARTLLSLGGVENHIAIVIGDHTVKAVPEDDIERTKSDGKTSAVHFLHFPFTQDQIAAFRSSGAVARLEIDHPNYGHSATMNATMRATLAEDFAA